MTPRVPSRVKDSKTSVYKNLEFRNLVRYLKNFEAKINDLTICGNLVKKIKVECPCTRIWQVAPDKIQGDMFGSRICTSGHRTIGAGAPETFNQQ